MQLLSGAETFFELNSNYVYYLSISPIFTLLISFLWNLAEWLLPSDCGIYRGGYIRAVNRLQIVSFNQLSSGCKND